MSGSTTRSRIKRSVERPEPKYPSDKIGVSRSVRLRFVLMLFVGMVAVVASVISALGYGLVCGIREARGDEFDRFFHTTVASVPLLWLPVAVGLVGLMAGVCFSVSAERTYPLAV